MKTRKEYKDYYLNKLLKKFGEFTERDYNSAHEFCYREEWDLGNNINAIDGLGDAWKEYEKRFNGGFEVMNNRQIKSGYDRNAQTLKALFSSADEIGNPDDWFEEVNDDSFIWMGDESHDFYDWLCEHKSEYPKEQEAMHIIRYYANTLNYEIQRAVSDLKFDNIPVNIETISDRLRKRNIKEDPVYVPYGFSKKRNALYYSNNFTPLHAFELNSGYYVDGIGVDKKFISDSFSAYNSSQSGYVVDNSNDKDPFSEGYDAYMRNDKNCPYKRGTDEFDDWVDGWQEAEMDMEP